MPRLRRSDAGVSPGVQSCENHNGRRGTETGFTLLIIIPPLLHTPLLPTPEVRDGPTQAA
jgi:hypothetical protein